MPMLDASGTYVRRLFAAACDKEKMLPDEETGVTLRKWRVESEKISMPNLAGLRPVIERAANISTDLMWQHNN